MLFNSPEFIFLFMPLVVVVHFTLARFSVKAAIVGTTVFSFAFYAWWNPPFILLLFASIIFNFLLILRIVAAPSDRIARLFLVAGIVVNVVVLCYFKYWDFLLSIVDGRQALPPSVPLALSFTTFVQVAFLVDMYRRRISLEFGRYALFVSFFPHLIAGPIVRWSSLGRQLFDPDRFRVDWNNIALGLTVFTFGLAKKVLIADALSPHVAFVFDAAARGDPVTAVAAWGGGIAFALQIYFDFSGYSDMAVGLGLLFNLRLPVNFAAPLRSPNIADLWRRWHITLARLFRDLVYVPLARGRSDLVRYVSLMLTLTIIGVWHGAGWTFVLWGAYNGALLVLYAGWVAVVGSGRRTRPGILVGWLLTFISFVIGAVMFRAPNIAAAWHLLTAMAGFGHAPVAFGLTFDSDDWMIRHGYVAADFVRAWFGTTWSIVGTLWTALAFAVMVGVPDTMEIVDYREGDAQSNWRRALGPFAWRPSPAFAGVTMILFAAAFTGIGRVSEFLYYQF